MGTDDFTHQKVDDTTIDTGLKDDVSISTLDLSLCQAYEEIFGDDEVLNMAVSLNADLFQQPFCLQSSEYEIDFAPTLDIQLAQAYQEIFGDYDGFTMLPTSNENLFHQPFHLQPDECKIDLDIDQDHEHKENKIEEHQSCFYTFNAIENSASLSSTSPHDFGEIYLGKHDMFNQSDGEIKQDIFYEPDGEIHLVKDIIN
ncbi:hypothetical protein ACA910_021397 [Epithemia clementina (nom. ined.)]